MYIMCSKDTISWLTLTAHIYQITQSDTSISKYYVSFCRLIGRGFLATMIRKKSFWKMLMISLI